MKKNVKRRNFIKTVGLATVACTTGMGSIIATSCVTKRKLTRTVNKRDAVFGLLNGDKPQEYYPVGIFKHFGKGFKFGDIAIKTHMDYFNLTGMDFVKIQYEQSFPRLDIFQKPSDWANMPFYKKDYYEDQLYVVKELVKRGKSLAPVIATIYSPFMCAGHTASKSTVIKHLGEDPEKVKKGLEIITDSLLIFAKECVKLGVDGFLASSQGGDATTFKNSNIFSEYIKPADLVVMNEINSNCDCNILHICDEGGDYDDLTPFLDYPGQIINCSTKVGDKWLTPADLYKFFGRTFMGGMKRKGVIPNGAKQEIQDKVLEVLDTAPERFILGADCTVPLDTDWENIRAAVDAAHSYNN